MPNNKICFICYNNETNNMLKCQQCKHSVCDECFSNIVFQNKLFMPQFIQSYQVYECPFCKYENAFSTKINNFNTNNKLIKLLIFKLNKNNKRYNELVCELNYLKSFNKEILDDNNNLENQLQNLRNFNFELLKNNKELKKQINNIEIQNINTEIINENI